MPPTTAKPIHLSEMPVSRLHWSLSILRSRYITDSPGLSSQAKIGLISAGAVICVLLVLILIYRVRRNRKILVQSSEPPSLSSEPLPMHNRSDFPASFQSLRRESRRAIYLPDLEVAGNFGRPISAYRESEIFVNPRDIWAPSTIEKALPEHVHDRNKGKELEHEIPELPPILRCREAGCPRTFTSQSDYNHHMRYHTKPEQCTSCDKSFGTTKDLKRHINAVHETTERYSCTETGCKYADIGFLRKDHLKRHIQRAHRKNLGTGDSASDMTTV